MTTSNYQMFSSAFRNIFSLIFLDEKWDVQSIKLLKKSFHDIERTSKPLKNKWQKVASEVNRVGGYSFSAEKCRLKIKGLKSKYERQKKKNNTSGESPASDEDDEDFDVFEKIPDMKPKAVLESGTGTSKKCQLLMIHLLKKQSLYQVNFQIFYTIFSKNIQYHVVLPYSM